MAELVCTNHLFIMTLARHVVGSDKKNIMTSKQTSILPACRNIKHYSGDTYSEKLIITDGNNDPIDLSAAAVTMSIKKKKGDTANYRLMSTVDSSITIGGTSSNELTIKSDLLNTSNEQMIEATYYYDLQITYSNGDVRTILAGDFEVISDVTRV